MTGRSLDHDVSFMQPAAVAEAVRVVRARPLAPDAFAPFGRVVRPADLAPRPVNENRGTRMDLPETEAPAAAAAREAMALYALGASPFPVPVALVERHILSEQLFWSLGGGRWLAVVMPSLADGSPDASRTQAFLGRPDEGIVYRAGVWHMPLVALDEPGRFLMRMAETGTAADCEEWPLARELMVTE